MVDGVKEEVEADQARELKSINFASRKNIYQMIEEKLETVGLKSHCLLRTICEVAQSNLYETNGVVGNLVHILFT